MNDNESILRRKRQNAERARAYRKRKKERDAMPSTATVQNDEPVSENISPKVLHQKKLNAERCRRYRLKRKRLKSGANFNKGTSDSDTSTSRELIVNPEESRDSSNNPQQLFILEKIELEVTVKQEEIEIEEVTVKYETIIDKIEVETEEFHRESYQILTNRYEDLISENPRLCPLCDRIFPNSYSFLLHNVSHLTIQLEKIDIQKLPKKDLFQCSCGVKLTSEHNLKYHINSTHTEIALIKCEYCECKIQSQNLLTHIRKLHAPNK